MPREVNGIQLAAQAPRLQPTLKVLLISGYTAGAPTDTHRLPEQFPGLAKPYRREQLAANPREIIDGKAAESCRIGTFSKKRRVIVMVRSSSCKVLAIMAFIVSAPPWRPLLAQQSQAVNRGVVEIETSGSAGMSVRLVEDLANLVDDGATRRVLPVVGKGALQILVDLKYLRGIDMAILPIDVLEYAKTERLYPGIESSLTYITKLHNEEFHLLARPEIQEISDLKDRKVNVDLRGSGTSITAARLFEMLKIPVTLTNDTQEVGLDKLRRGGIAALAFVGGKPSPVFASLKRDEGIHFLAIPLNAEIAAAYTPTRLSGAEYPELTPQNKPVETIAVGNVLAVAELRQMAERSRNVANFVDIFFTGFQSLLALGHHPKWSEVNLAAELPGWRRYAPANQWLQRNMQIAKTPSPEMLRTMFSRFVDERRQAIGGAAMTQQDKDALFQQFQLWQREQAR